MSLALLIPLSLAMGLLGLLAFFWALRHQQFEDLDGAAWRVLMTAAEEGAPRPAPGSGSGSAPETEAGRVGIEEGRFVVGAELIAAAFGIPVEDTRAMMRDGTITSRSERGEGGDAGLFRLTFYHGGRAFRIVVDAEGRILKRLRFDTPSRPSPGSAPRG